MGKTIAITVPISRLTRNTPFPRLPLFDWHPLQPQFGARRRGRDGLVRVLEPLEGEFRTSMELLGVTGVDQFKPEPLCKVRPTGPGPVYEMSAFPHGLGGRLI